MQKLTYDFKQYNQADLQLVDVLTYPHEETNRSSSS